MQPHSGLLWSEENCCYLPVPLLAVIQQWRDCWGEARREGVKERTAEQWLCRMCLERPLALEREGVTVTEA